MLILVMNNMNIRLCKKEDIPHIMKLGKDVFCKENWYKKSVLESVFRKNPKTCWVLEIGRKIEGVRFVFDDSGGRAWGWLIILDPKFRRMGLGSKLFFYTAKKLKKMGFRKVYADCSVKNHVSVNWHFKVGYRIAGVFRDWYGKGADAVIFDYDL